MSRNSARSRSRRSAHRKAQTYLIKLGIFWAAPLLVIASLYTLLALNGVRYDGISGIPTWLNAAGYWAALVVLAVFWRILWKSLEFTDEQDER